MPRNWIAHALLALCLIGTAGAAPLTRSELPDPLKSWVPWILDGEADAGCPHLFNNQDKRRCAWPGTLEIKAGKTGAGFSQDWHVYRENWVALPGDEQQWPQEVLVDGKPAAVLGRAGTPAIKLTPGAHRVSGRFAWAETPESLALGDGNGLLRLDLDGRRIAQPVRDDDNRLWLQRKADAVGAEEAQVRVHRKLIDGIPLLVETRIHLEVSGKSRELLIGRVLLPELIPRELVAPLPSTLAQDGSLKVQARAGTWELVLLARHPGPVKTLTLPPPGGLSAEEEIWAFEAAPLLRTAALTGVTAVDPQQTTLPKDWQHLPAYLMRAGAVIEVQEMRRGDSEPAPDKLALERRLWLSFDGQTVTMRDRIQGNMNRAARLTMGDTAQLGRVDVAGQDQLITRDADQQAGIEVKRGRLTMSADSQAANAPRSFPVTGWKHDFDSVSMELALPAGWRLLHADGVDRADGAWLARWNLLDFFLVLVIALTASQLWGRGWGLLTLLALVLSYQEPGAPRFAWLALLSTVALLRVLPAGRFKTAVGCLERTSLLVLILITLAFATAQVRGALYPVLEDTNSGNTSSGVMQAPMVFNEPPVPAAAPAESPALLESREIAQESESGRYAASPVSRPEKIVRSKADPKAQNYQRADPDAKVQTGPGLPDWRWHEYRLGWDGPVRHDQQFDLWLLSPTANRILVLLRLLLLALLLAHIAGIPLRPKRDEKRFGGIGKGLVVLALASMTLAQPTPAEAQMPDEKLLGQLKEKLLRPADCLPGCAEISRLAVQVAGPLVRLALDIDAAVDSAVPLPGGAKQWMPREARLDGKTAYVQHDAQGVLWLLAPAGKHRVELEGDLPTGDTLQLPLPLKPRRVDVSAVGWDVAGLSDDSVVADTLQLTRHIKAGIPAEAPQLPPFLRVERRLVLDLVWHVETTVRRASPPGVPALAQIPLLPGEAVTTPGVVVKDGKVQLNLAAQADALTWNSTLAHSDTLRLAAGRDSAWVETWIVAASTVWHLTHEGLPPLALDANQDADLIFQPWPGESLKLKIERPQGIAGQTLTIDQSSLLVKPGKRITDYQLTLVIRSSRGVDHAITLPADATLKNVSINGQSRPIRASGREVLLPISPGKQTVDLAWSVDQDIALSYSTLPVNLNLTSVNSRINLQVPHDRWLLLLAGPGIGPAILFWGKLLIMLALALALGRARNLPLKTRHWLLLAVGLTQLDWWASLLVVGWFFVLQMRSNAHATEADTPRWRFNIRQIGLLMLTLAMLAVLFGAVEGGLLGQPEMQIAGNSSNASLLRWYVDRSAAEHQQAWILSLPILAYRGLMLLWSLWLAWSLLGWLKWGWSAFGQGGLWRKKTTLMAAPASPQPPAQQE